MISYFLSIINRQEIIFDSHMVLNGEKIRALSRVLRFTSYMGMIGTLALPIIFWIYDGVWIWRTKGTQLFIDLSHLPLEHLEYIPFKIKVAAFFLDMLEDAFLFAILLILSKLFKLYEQLRFFTRESTLYIRLIGGCLLLSQLVHPFYVLLREYIWALPGQKVVIPFHSLIGFKTLFLACIMYLVAYIFEHGKSIEEEYKGMI